MLTNKKKLYLPAVVWTADLPLPKSMHYQVSYRCLIFKVIKLKTAEFQWYVKEARSPSIITFKRKRRKKAGEATDWREGVVYSEMQGRMVIYLWLHEYMEARSDGHSPYDCNLSEWRSPCWIADPGQFTVEYNPIQLKVYAMLNWEMKYRS